MKKKIILYLFLLPICISGFSQEYQIDLYSNAEYSKNIQLRPARGRGDEVTIPIVLSWDKKKGTIHVELKSNNSDNYIYFFPKTDFFRDTKKNEPTIWFSREMKRNSPEELIYKYWKNLENVVVNDELTKVKYYSLKDPGANMVFDFDVYDPNRKSCLMELRLYVVSPELKRRRFLFIPLSSKRDRKLQYLSEVSLSISLHDICESAELQNVIVLLTEETAKLQSTTSTVISDLNAITDLPCSKINGLKNMQPIGQDSLIIDITHERFIQYNECENLKTEIAKYNTAIVNHDEAVRNYNTMLSNLKKKCTTVAPPSRVDCSSIEAANKKLMALYYKIEQSNTSDLSFFLAEYEQITKNVVGNEKCKSYEAYKTWRSGIEKILNK